MEERLFSFSPPHPPPTTREDDLAVLRLIRSRRVGPATFHRLVTEHGTLAAALDALPAMAAAAGIPDYSPCPEGVARAELAAGRRAGARLLRWDDADYPADLALIDDAPPVLWVLGDLSCLTRPLVAVIGARSASALGLRMARGMAGALADAGVTVVAGLARGIDTAAHDASQARGTVAVMAGGIDVIYPAENAALARAIADRGCLVTEQPPGTQPVARHFPARNRIVSGLSRGVVVVEAAHRSGSLITARRALDQGREVLAVPGHPIDARAAGCNALIRDGATLVRNAEDVLTALGIEATAPRAAQPDGGKPDGGKPDGGKPDGGKPDGEKPDGGLDPSRGGARPVGSAVAGPGDAHGQGAAASAPDEAAPRPGHGALPPHAGTPHAGGPTGESHRASFAPPPAGDPGHGAAPARPTRLSGRDSGGPVALEQRLLSLLGPSPTDENMLIRTLGVAAAAIAPVILSLELDGRVTRLAGGKIALAG